jgi:hypothetical protein
LIRGDLAIKTGGSPFNIKMKSVKVEALPNSSFLCQINEKGESINCISGSGKLSDRSGRSVMLSTGETLSFAKGARLVSNTSPVLNAQITYQKLLSASEASSQPVHIIAGQGALFGLPAPDVIELAEGKFFVMTASPTTIKSANAEVMVTGKNMVAIRLQEEAMDVESCSSLDPVVVSVESHHIPLTIGEGCVLVNNFNEDGTLSQDGLARREFSAFHDGKVGLLKSDFSMISLIISFPELRDAFLAPINNREKTVMNGFKKTAVAYTMATNGRGPFYEDLGSLKVYHWKKFDDHE